MFKILQERIPGDVYRLHTDELKIIDTIFDAYMQCNAVPTFEYECTPFISPNPSTMGFLAAAGRQAWVQLLGDGAEEFWDLMIDSGLTAVQAWNAYAETHDL